MAVAMAKSKQHSWKAVASQIAEAPRHIFGHIARRFGASGRRAQKLRTAQLVLTTSEHHDDFRQMAFTFAVIALAAQVAKSDGNATRDEFIAFREAFPMPATEHEKIRQLYDMALRDTSPFVHHARRIAALFPVRRHRRLLKDVLKRLARLAMVDGQLNKAEGTMLLEIGLAFGLRRRSIMRALREPLIEAAESNPYSILGVKPDDSEAEIRKSYHKLMRENHPDQIAAQGGSQDAVLVASRQVAQLNAAYQAIRSERRA